MGAYLAGFPVNGVHTSCTHFDEHLSAAPVRPGKVLLLNSSTSTMGDKQGDNCKHNVATGRHTPNHKCNYTSTGAFRKFTVMRQLQSIVATPDPDVHIERSDLQSCSKVINISADSSLGKYTHSPPKTA